ncbi:MAG: fatty acid desaturase [Oceanicoccus sp.]|uniref:fatty acid desaturase n=1 Tax=Oceanicoccus sp. TaxID=2691044 RepID=UPI0026121F70|nr:fatty acid desaturase [Oceanicoccus sp.]MDG1773059.1 fatty acid desaturase [Oceanicoccus sp.]
MSAKPINCDQADDPERFKALTQRPKIAWPTILLLVAAYGLFGVATFAYIEGILPLFWAMLFNATASYLSFAVVHEAAHRAVSSNLQLNDWLGRTGILLLEPAPLLPVFRCVHMQHHRFTNDPTKDPDAYFGIGPAWLLPFKWMIFDVVYFKYYLKPEVFQQRPKSERVEFYLATLFGALVISAFTFAGWLEYYLLLFFIPTRITKFFIIWVFDFLPHYPHQTHAADDPFRSTSNRVGLEWLLTPLFVYQNYHLVHHLYPRVPFYRYIKVWNAKKHYHLSQNPAIVDNFSLDPGKADDGVISGTTR